MRDDLKGAIRSLRSNRGFTIAALIVLTLGIGATTAIFSVVDAVVLRGLPFDEHHCLVAVGQRSAVTPTSGAISQDAARLMFVAPQNYLDWVAQQQVFESMAAVASGWLTPRLPGVEPESLVRQRVTADFFKVLRVSPALGRTFTADNETAGADRVALLSDGLWRRRFGADPHIVGRVIPLELLEGGRGADEAGIGVMPPDFTYPVGAARPTDIWIPYVVPETDRDRTLMVQRIDLDRFTLLGQPLRVADGVDRLGPSAAFSVSASATLVYWQGSRVIAQPTWFQRDGRAAGTLGPPAAYMNIALSPDGEYVAVDRFDLTPGIWLFHRARWTTTRATFGGLYESTPVWSPGGDAFVFAAARDTPPNLYVKRMGVPGEEERLFRNSFQMFPQSWSHDGRVIAYVTIHPKTRSDIWLVPTSGNRTPTPFLQTEFDEGFARISPDGRWMAYSSNEAGGVSVYVTRFPQPGAKWSVSPKGGSFPIWRRDGRELFYAAPDGQLMAVPIAAGSEFQPGVAVPSSTPRRPLAPWALAPSTTSRQTVAS
jgi:hypothetical protein